MKVVSSTAMFLAVSMVAAIPGFALPVGVAGGIVHLDAEGRTLTVPAIYRIIDTSRVEGGIVITAYAVTDTTTDRERYLSEAWLIPSGADFDDRVVLASFETRLGESWEFCGDTISSGQHVALTVGLWEGAKTLVFDGKGDPVDVDWSPVESIEGFYADLIRPVAWITRGRDDLLVCSVTELGPGAYMAVVDVTQHRMEVLPMEEAACRYGVEIMNSFQFR